MIDYKHWKMKKSEMVIWLIIGLLGAGSMVFLFTRNGVIALPCAICGAIFTVKYREDQLREKICHQLVHEFRECMGFMMSLIRSGRSAESMIEALAEDLDPVVFPFMYEEIVWMKKGLGSHQIVEDLFMDLGKRSGNTDILDFAGILSAGKRTKGNLEEIMQHSIRILEEKMEVQEEMEVLLSGKKLEQNILNLTPFLLLLVLYLMNPGYLDPLYTTSLGQIMMVICIALMIISYYWAGKIMKLRL